MDTTFLSDKVGAFMAEKNLTLKQLSQMSGLSVSMLSYIRRGARGRRASYTTLRKLSTAMGMPVEHFSQN